MDAFLNDLLYAVRGLRRKPAFAFIAVLTLALGIGVNTAIFSVVHGAVLKPLAYPEPDRLVFITSQFPGLGFNQFWISGPEFVEFRRHNNAFASVGAYSVRAANVGIERPSRPVTAFVSDDLFTTLGVSALRGRTFTQSDTLPGAEKVAVLSYALWQGAFGGAESIVGQTVPIDGVATRIVGVMRPGVDVHDQKVELWVPLTLNPANPGGRASHFLYAIGRLKPAVSLQQARLDLDRLLRQWPKDSGTGTHVPNMTGHRLRFDALQDDIVGGVRQAAWVLQAAVAFVLLIACANLASLLLARAESRQKEFALRASLGAGPWRLLRQFIAEGLVLCLAGGAAGVVLASLGLDALLATNPAGIPRTSEIAIDTTVLGFTLAVSVACGLLFGIVPLLRLSHGGLHERLKESGARLTTTRGRRHARNVLVAGEVALAVVLVVGAGLMLRTFLNLVTVDAGFDRTQLVTFQIVLPNAVYKVADRPAFFTRLLDRAEHLPGVKSASAMSGLPPRRDVDANDTDFEDIVPDASGQNRGPAENVDYWQGVALGYGEAMGIPVIEGRGFEPTDVEGAPVVLVNETLAKTFFPGRSPIGRRLRLDDSAGSPWFTIVGVLKDVKQHGVNEKTGTELYLLNEQLPRLVAFGFNSMNVVLRTSLPVASLKPALERIVREMDPSLPVVKLRTMDDVFLESVSRPKFLALLLGVFAGLALLLAAVGIYGVLAYLVTERQQELGIRIALGARRGTVLSMILRQGLLLILAGVVAGVAGAVGLTRLLQSLLFGIRPADPPTLTAGVLFITLVGVAACLIPAMRATRVNPIVVLRSE
jgi:predicted permease